MPRIANPAIRSCFRVYAEYAEGGRDPGNLRPRAASCGSDRRCSDSSLDGLPKGRGRGGAVKRPARGEESGTPAGTLPGEARAHPDPPESTLHVEPTSKRSLGKEHHARDAVCGAMARPRDSRKQRGATAGRVQMIWLAPLSPPLREKDACCSKYASSLRVSSCSVAIRSGMSRPWADRWASALALASMPARFWRPSSQRLGIWPIP